MDSEIRLVSRGLNYLVLRRRFLFLLAAASGTAACNFVRFPEASAKQRYDDVVNIAKDIASYNYYVQELHIPQSASLFSNEAIGIVELKRPDVTQALVFTVSNYYQGDRVVKSETYIDGGLYQPEARAAIYTIGDSDERIQKDQLYTVTRAILNLSNLIETQLDKVSYPWGEVDAVKFKGITDRGRKYEGWFDVKGQGRVDVTP